MSGPFSWTFTTDPAAPQVVSESPASGATNVSVSTTATATFNEAVQASTINFTLTPSGGSPVSATVTYNSSNFTVTLTPSTTLASSTTYTATVSGAEDNAGDPMSGSFSWSFTTGASTSATFLTKDTTTEGTWIGTYGSQGYEVIANATSLPSYATVTPAGQSNAVWASKTSDPRALQYANGTSRIAACWYASSSFTINVNLTDGQTHDLALYALDWDKGSRSEQIQISNASTGAVLDTESISSFSNGIYLQWAVSGNLAIKVTHSGGTNAVISGLFFDPPSTTQPPTVTAESPANGATDVAVSTTATATFNEAVQSSTINFTLTPSGGSPVAATVTYNSSNYTATLTPSSALAYNTTYTATVSGAQSSSGVPMSGSFSWSFTTDPAPPA